MLPTHEAREIETAARIGVRRLAIAHDREVDGPPPDGVRQGREMRLRRRRDRRGADCEDAGLALAEVDDLPAVGRPLSAQRTPLTVAEVEARAGASDDELGSRR